MGTTSQKLSYLNDTKGKLKDSINKFRDGITDQTTFRDYATELDGIYDKLPKVSGNGSDFSLENAQNGKLDSFGMDGNTEQTTYSGKNLLAYTSYGETQQGVETTYDSQDGVLILNGTVNNTFSNITKESNLDISTGSYTFSITEAKNYNIRLRIKYTDETYLNATISKGDTSVTVNVAKPTLNQRIFIYEDNTLSGTVFTNEKIYAQLEEGSTPTNFEKYVGGTPSPNPDYPQEVKVVENEQIVNVTGKNLLDSSLITSTTASIKYIPIQCKANTDYTLSTNNVASSTNTNLFLSTQNSNVTSANNGTYLGSPRTINSGNNTTIYVGYRNDISNNWVQLEENSQATEYEPYQSQDFEIDLLDYELCKIEDYKDVIFKNNQLSEHYDSTLDEDGWYIKKNIGKVVLNGSENWFTQRSTSPYVFALNFDNYKRTQENICKCNFFSSIENGGYGDLTDGQIRFRYNSGDTIENLYVCTTVASTVNDFKTWLSTHNTTVYYVLETPTYETITNETLISQLESIETFTGLNNFSVSNENNVLPTLYVSRLKELSELS